MQKDPDKDFVPVNQILGKEASIGPIPTSQLLPWIGIAIISYTLTQGFFNLGMPWFIATTVWLIFSWWLLTGNQPHHFVNQFRKPPGANWYNAGWRYLSPLREKRPESIKSQVKDSQTRIKCKPISRTDQNGKQRTFMPFQNFQDLVCLVTIKKERHQVSGFLLNKGSQYQVVFGFRTPGLHNLLERQEITALTAALEEGLKDIPQGEKMTIHTGCFSDCQSRQTELNQLANNCQLTPISILVKNEQKRVGELTELGIRQQWEQIIFCTWTFNADSGVRSSDLISKTLRFASQSINKTIGWFTGNEQIYREQFFHRLLLKSFEQGFIPWEILLNTKIGLETQPCTSEYPPYIPPEGGNEGGGGSSTRRLPLPSPNCCCWRRRQLTTASAKLKPATGTPLPSSLKGSWGVPPVPNTGAVGTVSGFPAGTRNVPS